MSTHTIQLSPEVRAYILSTVGRESPALARIREATAAMPGAIMQTSPEQAQFLGLLVELLQVRRALEIGVFTGYSACAIAEALGPDGKLVACELSPEYAVTAEAHLTSAGLEDRVEIVVGPAQPTLDNLIRGGASGDFDFAYIDADKEGYDGYVEACLQLVRPGGLVAVDNVLWGGSVADPSNQKESTVAIRQLNAKLGADPRVTVSLVPIGDGLLLARRR